MNTGGGATGRNSQQHPENTAAFEPFLSDNQLPYYREARKKALAHQRMVIRLQYLINCKDNNLTPTEVVYRPAPPQGINLTPAEITVWKSKVTECEKIMLNLMIDNCRRDLQLMTREMDKTSLPLSNFLNDDHQAIIRKEIHGDVGNSPTQESRFCSQYQSVSTISSNQK